VFAGAYRDGGEQLPRVLHLSIARFRADLPRPGEPLEFLVTIHEEGTGISGSRTSGGPRPERELLDASLCSSLLAELGRGARQGRPGRGELGARLRHVRRAGRHGLPRRVRATAILLDADETILNLPWELIGPPGHAYALATPFGRLVTTRTVPARGRDPLQEDAHVQFLVVANPTRDLAEAAGEVAAIQALAGQHGMVTVEITVIEGADATRDRTRELLASGRFDVLHFSGHAELDGDQPGASAIQLADGLLSADDILRIPWLRPPGFVFGSACESSGSAAGRRLLSDDRQANGLAGAFLSAGVYAYAGFFWPVTDAGAALFTRTFYEQLFQRENVGLAFQAARQAAAADLGAYGDLAGYGAVLYGDAASKHRRDIYAAV